MVTHPDSLQTTTNTRVVSSGLSCLRSIQRVLEWSSTCLNFRVFGTRKCVEQRIIVASRISKLRNIIIRRCRQQWLKAILSIRDRLWKSRPSGVLWRINWRRIGFRSLGNYELSCLCRKRLHGRYVWLPKRKWESLIACEKPTALVDNNQHSNQGAKILNTVPLPADSQLHWWDPDDLGGHG